jgi:hypothetical protein
VNALGTLPYADPPPQKSVSNDDPTTSDELAATLLQLGDVQTLWDNVSPKALARLVELGMVRRASNRPPQLTTLGEIVFARVKAGEPIPDLEHLP